LFFVAFARTEPFDLPIPMTAKVVAVVLRDWLKKLLGRSVSPAEDARAEHQMDSDAVDRYAGRVMGVYGDIGPTVPSPESPPDRPSTD
jgi:hypothetical protein